MSNSLGESLTVVVPAPARVRTVTVVVAASVLASLDLFIVNLSFSSISASFPGATPQALSWVLNAYAVAFAALLIPSGRLADRLGRKRLFRVGMLAFAIGSAGSAAAPEVVTLIVARGVQGAGAALMVPTSLALLLAAFPKSRHKQMVSIWAATGSVAATAGPVLGGLLTQLDWRLIFLINLPIAIPALILAARLTETPRSKTPYPDLFGSALLALGVGALVTAISYVTDWGPASPWFWGLILLSACALAWFARRCLTRAAPAVDLGIFRFASLRMATIGMASFYIAFAIMLLGSSIFLQDVWQWTPAAAGLALAAGPATAIIASLLAGKLPLVPRTLVSVGGFLYIATCVLWALLLTDAEAYAAVFLPGMILTGAGAGFAQTGFLTAATADIPDTAHATGTGIVNTSRQIGGAIGVALLIALTQTGTDAEDYTIAWIVMGAAGLLATLTGVTMRSAKHAPDTGDAHWPSRTP
ncbi:MFS transporter [uncultured Leifsonia sp.]|uniref:MFS transporter n=1 Tax=uncultured Leifsonia sp. TaxID=340359 RepID=UPI000B0477BA|nr:MFS transporter [uncultured Leifsonia sp.]